MRNLKTYLSLLFMGTLALTACQDDFDNPDMVVPESTWLADAENFHTMTINEVKTKYWKSADNYYTTIGEAEDGKHILVKGTVISSDASGNIYKSLVIRDETGALAMSINANSMCVKYRQGQELVLDLTGMTIGKYSGLEQLGFPEESAQYGQQTTFMPYAFFEQHVQMNGLPAATVEPVTVTGAQLVGGGDENLIKWQSQYVRFNNCYFEEGGKEPFGIEKENTNRVLVTEDGTKINVRTSGYSNFYTDVLPEGHGDVCGILGYYAGTSDTGNNYQLTLIDRGGCMNFGNPTVGKGAESNPYLVDEAISIIAGAGSATQVWVTGYIVGAVAPGVAEITGNNDIQFSNEPEMDNTLVIAADKDCKDYTKCMIITLPQGTSLRTYGNLVDHKDNYGKQMWIKGNLATVMGTYGITGNNGTASEFRIEGVDVPDDGSSSAASAPDFNTMNGGEATPYYGTFTSTNGWVATNAILLQGGTADNSPVFTVFGGSDVFAVCLNGNTSKVGTLTSPVISGGVKTLNFDYCQPFTDSKCKLTINIKQGGAIVATDVLENNGMTKLTKYHYAHAFNLQGDFQIEIINNCPSEQASNKDRVAIWNLGWGEDNSGNNDPVNPPTPPTPSGQGSGTESDPYTVGAIIAFNPQSTTEVASPDQAGVWVEGYIVGYYYNYDAHFTTEGAQGANILMAASASATDKSQCICIQLINGTDARKALNLIDNPGNLGKKCKVQGDVMKYNTLPGIKNTSGYSIDGTSSGGNDDPVVPPTPSGSTTADFNTMNGGVATAYYGTLTSTNGWVANNSNLLQGGATDGNPVFTVFGGSDVFAVCLNGNTSKVGSLTSPTISGGIKTLSFDYCQPYADTKCKLTINIKQNGTVVASDILENNGMTKLQKYSYSHAFNVTGNFTIEIVNDSPSAQAANKDRVAIWNLTWN